MKADSMTEEIYTFFVRAENESAASRAATDLADKLREIDGVLDTQRDKDSPDTMDLGTIVSVIAASGATFAIAQGIADWLRARRGATVVVDRNGPSGSIKAIVTGIDNETAARIVDKTMQ